MNLLIARTAAHDCAHAQHEVFACMYLSSELSENDWTSGHRKRTQKVHTRVSPASLIPRLLRFRKEFLLNWIYVCFYTFVHMSSDSSRPSLDPRLLWRRGKRARYTLLVHARTFPSYWPQNNLDNFYDHVLVIRIHNQQYFTEYLREIEREMASLNTSLS